MSGAAEGAVVVTGASRGVGAALARRLAGEGRTVIAMARDAASLAALAAEPRAGGRIVPLAVDLADTAGVRAAFATAERDHGPIDALVNNAGIFTSGDFAHQDLAEAERVIAVNLLGAMACTHAVLPAMRRRRRGRLIAIASVAALRGITGQAAYCAAKHGMLGFFDALGEEVRADGILVTVVCPGGIDTPLWDGAEPGSSRYPGDRFALMAPDEVAELIAFVLSRPSTTVYKRLVAFPACERH